MSVGIFPKHNSISIAAYLPNLLMAATMEDYQL
jgi:hypothetical protein